MRPSTVAPAPHAGARGADSRQSAASPDRRPSWAEALGTKLREPALASQPTTRPGRRVRDPAVRRAAEDGRHVVAADRAPVDVAARTAYPPLDPAEHALDPRPVPIDVELAAVRGPVPHPCGAVGLEHRDEAVLPGEHEDVVGPVAGDRRSSLLLIASRFRLQPSPNGP